MQAGWSGELYYAPPTLRTDWRTFARPVGEWNSPTRVSSQVSGGGSGRPCRPCQHRLAPIEALSVPHRQPGAGSRTCQAYGVRSNLRHVPSDEGARDLGKTRFNEVFGRAREIADPRRGKGVNYNGPLLPLCYLMPNLGPARAVTRCGTATLTQTFFFASRARGAYASPMFVLAARCRL